MRGKRTMDGRARTIASQGDSGLFRRRLRRYWDGGCCCLAVITGRRPSVKAPSAAVAHKYNERCRLSRDSARARVPPLLLSLRRASCNILRAAKRNSFFVCTADAVHHRATSAVGAGDSDGRCEIGLLAALFLAALVFNCSLCVWDSYGAAMFLLSY